MKTYQEFLNEQVPPYSVLRAALKHHENEMYKAKDVLKKYPRGKMGLVPDEHRDDNYRKHKKAVDHHFQQMRNINGLINRHHKDEHKAAMDKERETKRNR